MPPIIELRNVSYRAGETRILERVSWQISAGEHWALLGPNGAGKTTLLRLACGYLWPNAGGEILRLGESLSDLRSLRRSIGWVSSLLNASIPREERALDTVVSGRFAQMGLKWIGNETPSDDDYERADALMKEIGCHRISNRAFGVLSQGEQQKILIARARMAAPLLLILDEPCAGLDPGARERVLDAIDQIARSPQGPSMVIVTHHVEEIMAPFSHLLVLSEGRVTTAGPKEKHISAKLFDSLYGRQVSEIIEHDGRYWPIW
ncbi:MAG: ATP-binding cassette domain-containing protein [Planctomycetales bacterium]|nr:ATP-binding cassette domain-containing protein [Planctomycetales bacterium]